MAYLYLERVNTFINGDLVKDGYARAKAYPPNVRYKAQFAALEAEARANRRGLWGSCDDAKAMPGKGFEPKRFYSIVEFLLMDRDCSGEISLDEAMTTIFERQGADNLKEVTQVWAPPVEAHATSHDRASAHVDTAIAPTRAAGTRLPSLLVRRASSAPSASTLVRIRPPA